jgi:hypothetical protein
MAKRLSSSLSGLSLAEIQLELRRRQRTLPSLARKRAALMAKVAQIDAQIAALGGSSNLGRAGGAKTSIGSKIGSTRAANTDSLLDSLTRVLTKKTMSVTAVTAAVQKAGYVTNSPNFRTIVNAALLNKKLFKRVSRGKYTAV